MEKKKKKRGAAVENPRLIERMTEPQDPSKYLDYSSMWIRLQLSDGK